MTDLEKWEADRDEMGWVMPKAAWWKRLPIIRNIRASYHYQRVSHHNTFWLAAGKIPTGYDNWVLWGMAHGKEQPHD